MNVHERSEKILNDASSLFSFNILEKLMKGMKTRQSVVLGIFGHGFMP